MKRPLDLAQCGAVRAELAHVYYAARDDEIPAKKAGTLVYALVQLAKVIQAGEKHADAHELPRGEFTVTMGNRVVRNGVVIDELDEPQALTTSAELEIEP